MAKGHSQEIYDFLSQHVKGTTTRDLLALVNAEFGTVFTEASLKAYKSNHKLKSGTRGIPKGRPSKQFPEEVRAYIYANYKGTSHAEMAVLLNKKFGTPYTPARIKGFYGNHKLNSGLTGRFPKGHVPANKGQKGIRCSPETEFKKGNRPHTWKPIGTETVRGDGYSWVKIAENRWREKHVLLWEAENGPVPKGHTLLFADGNRLNVSLDNLILVSRAQLARLNQNNLIHIDSELTRLGVMVADLINKIGSRKRGAHKSNKSIKGGCVNDN